MTVQDSFIALGASMLAVRLWFVLFILLLGFGGWLGFCLVFCLGFCLILGAGSGCRAEALRPALIWFVFFCVRLFVWLAW